jgi:hypothetical protein
MSNDLTGNERLAEFIKITDTMIAGASKDEIAEAARMLAIQVGHYQRKFGLLPVEELQELNQDEILTEDNADWIADGLEHLAVTIATVKDNEKPPTMQ